MNTASVVPASPSGTDTLSMLSAGRAATVIATSLGALSSAPSLTTRRSTYRPVAETVIVGFTTVVDGVNPTVAPGGAVCTVHW
ncbi:MAG: hypothetical protein R6W83_12730 [Cryobacterium sp.]